MTHPEPQSTSTPLPNATLLTLRTPLPFSTIETRLRTSIQPNPSTTYANASTAAQTSGRNGFESALHSALGPHDLMYFAEYNHGAWTQMYLSEMPNNIGTETNENGEGKGLKHIKFVLGNPLVAKTMLKWDLRMGAFVPVELGLVEMKDGGTEGVYLRREGLAEGLEGGEEMRKALRALDRKVERLLGDVFRED